MLKKMTVYALQNKNTLQSMIEKKFYYYHFNIDFCASFVKQPKVVNYTTLD